MSKITFQYVQISFALIFLSANLCAHGGNEKLQMISSPQSAYILSDSEFEYSFPDLYTLSHLRIYIGEKSNYQFHVGVGLILLDLGYSKIIYRFDDKYPVKSQTIVGYSLSYQFILEQKFCFGITENNQKKEQFLFNLSFASGYKTSGKYSDEKGKFYLSQDFGITYRFKKTTFSLSGGISQIKTQGFNSFVFGNQIGFSLGYLIE